MKQTAQWSVRRMECPECDAHAELLIEWKVEKGKKVLQSIHCDSVRLSDYSGADCQWFCLEKISGGKKAKK